MPFVAPLIGAVIGGLAATALGQAVISIGLSVGLSYLAKRLTPKASNQGQSSVSLSLRYETNESREIAFGRVASAGSLKYHSAYGPHDNDYIQLNFVLADHECDGLEKVFVNGVDRPFIRVDTGGAPSGTFLGDDCWVEFHSGAWDQAADTDLIAGNPAYSVNDRGRGVCWARVTIKYDATVYAEGVPAFLFVFRGAKLYDWRLDSTNGGSGSHRWGNESTYEWTDNPAVCLYNYRRGVFVNGSRLGGMSTPATSLPVAKWTAAANACEEEVDLLAGGTEARYRLNGLVPVQSEHAGVIRDMLAAMAGVEIDTGGVFVPKPGVAQASVVSFLDTDLIANEQAEIIPKLSRSVLINAVFGTFHDPAQLYAATALPPRISPEDEATDGAQLADNFALEMVTSGTQGQRVLEILRRKGRYQRRVTCKLRSRFAVLESGDWITWTSDRYGWTSMVFEVLQATLNRDLTVAVELREVSTSIFAWAPETDELAVEDPHAVSAGGSSFTTVTGIELVAVLIEATGGIERPGLNVTWDAITDLTVTDLKLQYRKVGDTVALEKIVLDPGAGTYTWVEGIQGGVAYEARLSPITIPERVVAWTAWTAMEDTTEPQVVDVALIAEAVPPDTITAVMLAAQERFELGLMTALDSVEGSASQIALHAFTAAQVAAEAAIAGHLEHVGNQTLIKTEETRRLTSDEAFASLITTVQADLGTAEAAIVTEQTARTTADTALATSISTETASRTSADSALSASVSSEATSRVAGDTANASSITTEIANRTTADGTIAASVSTEATARASADTALALLISTLTTTVGGHTTSITSILSSVDGIEAHWGIQIDVDGNVVGLVRLDGVDDYSVFTVVADVFQIAQPGESGGDPIPVFTIADVNGVAKLALRGDMLIDGSVLARHMAVATLDAISADVGELTAGIIRSTDSSMIIDLDNGTIVITT